MTTIRYRGQGRIPYAHALIVLAEYARGSDAAFDFGPDNLADLLRHGLTVTGPDLEMAGRLLDKVPGLHRLDE